MKKLILILFTVSLHAGETNTYNNIVTRNAFNLTSKAPTPLLPPVSEILAPSVFMTGITRWNGTNKVHLVLRGVGQSDKFVSLGVNERQYNIEVKNILKDSALISSNGNLQLLNFKANRLPSIITKAPTTKKTSLSSRYSRDRKEESKSNKDNKNPTPPSANVVKVPSRRPVVDPRVIEKSLEYLAKTENDDKREYVLQRLERLQNGQENIDRKIDHNEMRRQYDKRKEN